MGVLLRITNQGLVASQRSCSSNTCVFQVDANAAAARMLPEADKFSCRTSVPPIYFFEEKEDSPLCAASQNQRQSSEEKTTREEQGQFNDVTMAEVGKDEALAFLPISDRPCFQKSHLVLRP
jgi:hypothetical protein